MNEYGLIGYPLEQSFSKRYFTDKFEREGLDCSFHLFPLHSINALPQILNDHKRLQGLAVTIPYKQQVIPYLTALDDSANQIGAVNCINIREGILTGYNTDIIGFERSLLPFAGKYKRSALVLGTGGASKAVQFVLQKLGYNYLLVSRGPLSRSGHIGYDELNKDLLQEYPVIINCTPAGMYPNIEDMPCIPYHFLSSDNFLYDLIYKPEKTKFLEIGERYGTAIKNGFEMLITQAEENWRIWNS